MTTNLRLDPEPLDFHLIVSSLQEQPELGFVAAVVYAPVERWGTKFHLLKGCDQLMRDLVCDGVHVDLDVRGHMKARWRKGTRERDSSLPDISEAEQASLQVRSVRQARHRLFRFLFPEKSNIYDLLASSCERAQREGATLRVKLELPAMLSNLPWEMMRCPPDYPRPVVSQARMAIVRYVCETEAVAPKDVAEGAPVVLLVRAGPPELMDDDLLQSFDIESEKLKEVFRRHGLSCEVVEGPDTIGQLKRHVGSFRQRIIGIHFIGHGDCDDEGGYLVTEDGARAEKPLYFDDLNLALEDASGLQWIFLNACSSGYTPAGCPLSGLATTLSVIKNVPIVLAYTRPVATNVADMIAPPFYGMMLDAGKGIDAAVRDLMKQQEADSSGLVVLVRMVSGKMQTRISLSAHAAAAARSTLTLSRAPQQESGEPDGVPASPSIARFAGRPGTTTTADAEGGGSAAQGKAERGVPGRSAMVLVPAGKYRRGLEVSQLNELLNQFENEGLALDPSSARRALSQENPEDVDVSAFEIDEAPVTNSQFQDFVEATHWVTEAERRRMTQTWRDYRHLSDHPVVFVSYDDALKFCEWADKRLPTADEWKKAFRGTDGRIYPWGSRFDAAKCNTAESQRGWETTPVRMFPQGRSPCGCYDMVGNVEEWTASALDEDRRILLGGSWCMTCQVYGLPVLHRLAPRSFFSNEVGFRCAKDVGQ